MPIDPTAKAREIARNLQSWRITEPFDQKRLRDQLAAGHCALMALTDDLAASLQSAYDQGRRDQAEQDAEIVMGQPTAQLAAKAIRAQFERKAEG